MPFLGRPGECCSDRATIRLGKSDRCLLQQDSHWLARICTMIPSRGQPYPWKPTPNLPCAHEKSADLMASPIQKSRLSAKRGRIRYPS